MDDRRGGGSNAFFHFNSLEAGLTVQQFFYIQHSPALLILRQSQVYGPLPKKQLHIPVGKLRLLF